MLSSKQQEYLQNCNHRWNIKIGATGSGKSWLDYAYVIPKRMMALKGQGASVILGNTQGTAIRNILEPMRELHGETLVTEVNSRNWCRIYGKKVYVLGADNKTHINRIRGMTIEYAYGDEMTTWNEGVFQMLKSRLRCEHSYFDGTGNPEAPTNYLKQFLDSDADIFCQKSTIFDNPFLPKQFVDDLCAEYEGTVYYPRYILGEWTRAEGLIYPMYEDAIIDDLSEDYSEYVLSVDYGTQNAFSAGLWARTGDVWHRIDEYYYSGRETGIQKADDEYADDLDKFTGWLFEEDENGYTKLGERRKLEVIIDPSAASFKAMLQKRGRYKVHDADNDVLNGIRNVATCLNRGKIKVHRSCKNWIKEVAGYTWDDKATDTPIKENDHAMDDTRYFVNTKRIAKEKRHAHLSRFA